MISRQFRKVFEVDGAIEALDVLYLFLKNLFLAVLGLRCCARAFSSCGEWGLLLVAVHRLLIAVASLVAEPEL